MRLDLLDLFGRGYVVEHCVSTLNSLRAQEAYQMYTAELLRGIANSLGIQVSSYTEFLEQLKPKKEETRTSEEVVDSIREKARKLKGGE